MDDYCIEICWRNQLSRVINPDSVGKERTKLTKNIVKAIRALILQKEPNQLTMDLAAYISLALEEIHNTVDVSVEAWEKRGYWIKADRFRLDWEWTEIYSTQMKNATLTKNWGEVASLSAKIAQKFSNIKLAPNNRLGEPWQDAWKKIK
jgi:hypothetical protein